MKTLVLALTAAALATGANAGAITYTFGVSPDANLGTTHPYTESGLTIVASGFDHSNSPTDLYGKTDGGDENGVGLANDPTGDHEIHLNEGFVQLDVSQLIGNVNGSATDFTMGSTTDGETWAVYGSHAADSLGAQLTTGTDEASHLLPDFGMYRYYDFVEIGTNSDSGENVLLSQITTTTAVPEPATWTMMLFGFFGLGGILRGGRGKRALEAA